MMARKNVAKIGAKMTDKYNRPAVILALIIAACIMAVAGLADSTILAVIGALVGPVSSYVAIKGRGGKPE